MKYYILFTDRTKPNSDTILLRSPSRMDDMMPYSSDSEAEAKERTLEHRELLLDKSIKTNAWDYQIFASDSKIL